jgi:hypothetical protein
MLQDFIVCRSLSPRSLQELTVREGLFPASCRSLLFAKVYLPQFAGDFRLQKFMSCMLQELTASGKV